MNDKIDQAIHETRVFLAERPAPVLRSAVMSRIENVEPFAAEPRPALLERIGLLLWAPREISIRPAFGLAAAAALAALVLVPYMREAPSSTRESAITAADAHVFVQFHLET